MRYEFHPEALAEYDDASAYYAQREEGLDLRFIEAIEQAIQQILECPERWRVLEGTVRRHLTKVFPYAIVYTIEPEFVLILAVMHCHREPGFWHRRVSRPSE